MEELYYPSADGIHQIHAIILEPEGKPKGIIQLVHGMCEYIERYLETAEYFVSKGFIFAGEDHLGHGKSVSSPDELGYFCEKEPEKTVVKDVNALRLQLESRYPGLPVFLIGHSMGSFIARDYITEYGKGLSAAVLLGGNDTKDSMSHMGGLVIRVTARRKGWKYRSDKVKNLVMGSYTKKLQPGESPNAWISHRKEVVDAYDADPLCTYNFTLNGFYALTRMAIWARQPEALARIPKDLPILIMSGIEDPVGEYGEGVKRMARLYEAQGLKRVELTLVEGDRHELHNEADRQTTWDRILAFFESTLPEQAS